MPFVNYNETTVYQPDTHSVVYNEVMIGDTLRSASDRSRGSLPNPLTQLVRNQCTIRSVIHLNYVARTCGSRSAAVGMGIGRLYHYYWKIMNLTTIMILKSVREFIRPLSNDNPLLSSTYGMIVLWSLTPLKYFGEAFKFGEDFRHELCGKNGFLRRERGSTLSLPRR